MMSFNKLGIDGEPRELIIGESFRKPLASSSRAASSDSSKKGKNGSIQFHTLRYDFKPASVDPSKMATMEFSQSNDKVKVTVPNVEASNQPETIFTGSKKPHLKECVLIIDHETGETTLERLTHSINVKKTRDSRNCQRTFNEQEQPRVVESLNSSQPETEEVSHESPRGAVLPANRPNLQLSDSNSDSESDSDCNTTQPQPINNIKRQLNKDLCLSEESSEESG